MPAEGLLENVAEFGTATVLLNSAAQWVGIALLAGIQLPGDAADAAFLRLVDSEAARGVPLVELDDSYSVETRRPVAPWVVRVRDRASAREAKRRILERSQKRTLDLFATYLHRPIELRLASWLAETPITANQVSVVVVAIALGIAALLATDNLLLGALLMPLATYSMGSMASWCGSKARRQTLGSSSTPSTCCPNTPGT